MLRDVMIGSIPVQMRNPPLDMDDAASGVCGKRHRLPCVRHLGHFISGDYDVSQGDVMKHLDHYSVWTTTVSSMVIAMRLFV